MMKTEMHVPMKPTRKYIWRFLRMFCVSKYGSSMALSFFEFRGLLGFRIVSATYRYHNESVSIRFTQSSKTQSPKKQEDSPKKRLLPMANLRVLASKGSSSMAIVKSMMKGNTT